MTGVFVTFIRVVYGRMRLICCKKKINRKVSLFVYAFYGQRRRVSAHDLCLGHHVDLGLYFVSFIPKFKNARRDLQEICLLCKTILTLYAYKI